MLSGGDAGEATKRCVAGGGPGVRREAVELRRGSGGVRLFEKRVSLQRPHQIFIGNR